jgi:site-specific recombinase XerD
MEGATECETVADLSCVRALKDAVAHCSWRLQEEGAERTIAVVIMQRHIVPVARALGISKRIGWHTFRHAYSTLLRSTGAELKIMQELLRHSTIRVTLDTYTQAVTTEKRNAQDAVVAVLCPRKTQ